MRYALENSLDGRNTVTKHCIRTTLLLFVAVGLAACAGQNSGETGLELLPPISNIQPGVSKQGSLANAKLIADTTSALESSLGEKLQSSKILKFVIQKPVGTPGNRAWREMWIVPHIGNYIITFSEDGPSAANFKIKAMK